MGRRRGWGRLAGTLGQAGGLEFGKVGEHTEGGAVMVEGLTPDRPEISQARDGEGEVRTIEMADEIAIATT